eukprot:1143893-Pelagomonas_calceolata.AAC.9
MPAHAPALALPAHAAAPAPALPAHALGALHAHTCALAMAVHVHALQPMQAPARRSMRALLHTHMHTHWGPCLHTNPH